MPNTMRDLKVLATGPSCHAKPRRAIRGYPSLKGARRALRWLLLGVIVSCGPHLAQAGASSESVEQSGSKEEQPMSTVSLGENSKLTVRTSERERVRKFFRDVLGCPQTKESARIDVFRIGSNF